MAVTAGALSKVLVGSTTAQLSSAAATAGTGPYTYQWYRSQTTGFTPGAGSLIAGATALTLSDSGLQPGVTYYYVVIATDTGAGNATSTSAQLTVGLEPSLIPNQFAQGLVVGMVDLKVGSTNVLGAMVDVSVTTQIYAGQAVKIVANTAGGVPYVAPCTAKDDDCIGFAIFNSKDIKYVAGQALEIALFGTVIWAYATAAINPFVQVALDTTFIGGVQPAGATATLIGWSIDGCAAAGPIRIFVIQNTAFATI